MSNDWIAKTEAERVNQAQDFATKIAVNPVSLGLTAAEATSMQNDATAFATAFSLATNPVTRTKITVEDKDIKEATCIARMRSYGKRIVANLSVSDTQKSSLGLNIRPAHPTPIPPPSTKPVLSVVSSIGRTVRVRMTDEATPTKRAKPAGVSFAEVFSATGENPPTDISAWKYEGAATRALMDVIFPGSLATGTRVWIAARWVNGRGEHGAVSDPVNSIIVAALSQAA